VIATAVAIIGMFGKDYWPGLLLGAAAIVLCYASNMTGASHSELARLVRYCAPILAVIAAVFCIAYAIAAFGTERKVTFLGNSGKYVSNTPAASHGAAQGASHGAAQGASHGAAQGASHGAAQGAH